MTFDPRQHFRAIGQLKTVCPTCGVLLDKRPQRKTQCPHCGEAIYARKRPYDDQQVLLRERDLPALEKDWELDYKIKAAQPRELSPEWKARFDVALANEDDPDPVVEREAHNKFAQALGLIRQGMAPRDAFDHVVPPHAEGGFMERIKKRIWQLQVRSMGTPDPNRKQ